MEKAALVIGGSVAGLLAAQAATHHFESVTILERDRLPETPAARKGVPQARHIHVLLTKGFRLLTEMFPDLAPALIEAGAVPINWSAEAQAFFGGAWTNKFPSDMTGVVCSRDLLEWQIRQQLLRNPQISIMSQCRVNGLVFSQSKVRVTGVVAHHDGAVRELRANLIIDASGRNSRLPEWLWRHGFEAPVESTVNAELGYATGWFELAEPVEPELKGVIINAVAPHLPRGAAMLRCENERWVVTLAGRGQEHLPPTEPAGFHTFLTTLADSRIADLLKGAELVSRISGYQRNANRWRHFERLSQHPAGIVALGDAVCAFNPIYGQGMSAAALSAQCLRQALAADLPHSDFPAYFYENLAEVVATPWLLATGEDFRWPVTIGTRPGWSGRLMQRYVDLFLGYMPSDDVLADHFFRVTHLLAPPQTLVAPAILRRLVANMLLRRLNRRSQATGGSSARPLTTPDQSLPVS